LTAARQGGGKTRLSLATLILIYMKEPVRPVYLFVLPWSVNKIGGVTEVVKNLYRNIARATRYAPAILINDAAPAPPNPEWRVLTFSLLSPLEAKWKARLAFLACLPVRLFRLARLLRAMRVEVVNPHFPELGCLHFVLLQRLGLFRGRLVLSFHLSDLREASRSKGLERWLWRTLIASADASVCCSQALARHLSEFVPAARKKIHAVWNGIDPDQFLSEAQPPAGVTVPSRFLLNVGTFEHKKGHDVLIKAFALLCDRYPDLMLVIAGRTGATLAAVQQQIKSGKLEDRVIVCENLSHSAIPHLLARADIFVLPSRAEGFPIVLLEAGACGTPVVATSIEGVPELITDKAEGRLVPPDDPDALAAAIAELLSDTETRRSLGQHLQRKITEQLSWSRACDGYMRIVSGERAPE